MCRSALIDGVYERQHIPHHAALGRQAPNSWHPERSAGSLPAPVLTTRTWGRLVPTAYLLGVVLVLGCVTRGYWIAAGAVVGYWWCESMVGRTVSGVLDIVQHSRPAEKVHAGWNRVALAAAGAGLMIVNPNLAARRAWRWR